MLIYPVISLIATIAFMTFDVKAITILCAFVIVFFLAGVMHLSLSLLYGLFCKNKGRMTRILCTATAGIPFVTGMITCFTDVKGVFVFSLIINALGILLALVVNYRYQKLTKVMETEEQMAA